MKHSIEINFLRSIAITGVVGYHFFPSIVSYGFLGVDIFFVISGYLISISLVINNSNSLKNIIQFYKKRIKRIFPALFIFFLITTLILNTFFLKNDFYKYLDSLIASKTFLANIYFWRDGGYFGNADKLKPLLHLWSLAVEMQFYIIFPIFLLLINKLKVEYFKFIFFLSATSLIIWIFLNKIGGENPAFFLTPSRFWQLGLGASLALIILKGNVFFEREYFFKKYFFIKSIFLIILLLFFKFDKNLQTFLITIISLIYIAVSYNIKNYFLPSFIKNKQINFFGKISFSLYLYHWLIVVMLNYFYINEVPFIIKSISLIFSILLAYCSFFLIERPFIKLLKFKYTLILILLCTFSNYLIFANQGKIEKLNFAEKISIASGTNFRCEINQFVKYGSSRACILVDNINFDKKIALIGNSHAQMYAPLLIKPAIKNKKSLILVPLNSCLPTETVNLSSECIDLAKKNNDAVLNDKSILQIFISTTWYSGQYFDYNSNKKDFNEYINSLKKLIQKFENGGKKVYLFSPIPIPNKNLTSIIPRLIKFNKKDYREINNLFSIFRENYDKKFLNINKYFSKTLNYKYLKVYNDLCNINKCYFIKNNINYFADGNHLSKLSLNYLVNTKEQIEFIFDKDKL